MSEILVYIYFLSISFPQHINEPIRAHIKLWYKLVFLLIIEET